MGREPKNKGWIKHSAEEILKVKSSLSLRQIDPLPRCPAKSNIAIKGFEEAGDFSHSNRKHQCNECRCHRTAGLGTNHLGVGYCFYHESGRRMSNAVSVARNMKVAIQQGYPDEPWRYKSNETYLSEVREAAEKAQDVLSMREELNVLRTTIQQIVSSWDERGEFTELYKGEEIPASDATKAGILAKLIDSIGKLARVQLDVTSEDYVHAEEVKMWIGEFIRIIENTVTEEQFESIIEEIKKVPQPMTGKRK